jgi:hypothetical protein
MAIVQSFRHGLEVSSRPSISRHALQWLAVVGSGWQWLAVVGSGWQWLAVVGSGWQWLAMIDWQ